MAVAAFKSSSRRGNLTSPSGTVSSARESREEARKKAPIRRSKSVSAFSRTSLDISTEFVNKRDNPLFWSSTSPRDGRIEIMETEGTGKLDGTTTTTLDPPSAKFTNSDGGYGLRGRSVTRDDAVSCKGPMKGRKETGRSLSRLDTSRRNRSSSQVLVSRRHYLTSESEAEQEYSTTISKDANNLELLGSNGKGGFTRSNNGVINQMKKLPTWPTDSSFAASDNSTAILSCLLKQNCKDAVLLSTASSVCDSEEKTIKAVCEKIKLVPLDMMEASDIYETVRSEVRRAIFEIQNDLENSQERARKLRPDLAVEEHRTQELDRILKEVLPYPNTPNMVKSCPRKASVERRKMSKRLAEDAMAYFDECVSLSPFDSSDFSSQDDPLPNLFGPPMPSDSHLPEGFCSPEQSITNHDGVSQPNQSINIMASVQDQPVQVVPNSSSLLPRSHLKPLSLIMAFKSTSRALTKM